MKPSPVRPCANWGGKSGHQLSDAISFPSGLYLTTWDRPAWILLGYNPETPQGPDWGKDTSEARKLGAEFLSRFPEARE